MPIKGVSEVRRLNRLGKVRLGIKKESLRTGNPYPEATDYFVCEEPVRKIYGEKPTELKIVFPTEDAPSQWLKRYSLTRGLVCRGDGETAVAQCDPTTGEIATYETQGAVLSEISCDPDKCSAYQQKQCRRVMTLQFMLPDVPTEIGVWQLDTSSFNSIVAINSTLDLVRSICGRINMIPFMLRLVPQQVQPEGKKKTVHVLQLAAPYTISEILQCVKLPPAQVLMPAPDTEPPEDLYPSEVLEKAEGLPSVEKGKTELTLPKEPQPQLELSTDNRLVLWGNIKGLLGRISRDHNLYMGDAVANWFSDHYKIEVTVEIFDRDEPSKELTETMLNNFHNSLLAYEANLKRKG